MSTIKSNLIHPIWSRVKLDKVHLTSNQNFTTAILPSPPPPPSIIKTSLLIRLGSKTTSANARKLHKALHTLSISLQVILHQKTTGNVSQMCIKNEKLTHRTHFLTMKNASSTILDVREPSSSVSIFTAWNYTNKRKTKYNIAKHNTLHYMVQWEAAQSDAVLHNRTNTRYNGMLYRIINCGHSSSSKQQGTT